MNARTTIFACFITILDCLSPVSLLHAQEDWPVKDAAEVDFFETRIRPALVEHCLECHAADTEANGGVLLDSRAGWLDGGDSGRTIVPGDASASLLMRAISYDDVQLQMPPDGKLDEAVIEDFEKWISAGAIDPRVAQVATEPRQTGLAVERALEHWAYRPIGQAGESHGSPSPASPDDRAGAIERRGIDAWVTHQQIEAGIGPADVAPLASAEVLARRLYFDLIGLPPTPEQLRNFVTRSEQLPQVAYGELIDELLASPHFGEAFARRWMDVVRYADSITLRGFVLPEAWRYRDYLISAYAEDRPFSQMIAEQIAGDQLADAVPETDYAERTKRLVATGFWVLGNNNLEQQDKAQLEMNTIDEQLEVMGGAFLGQTIGCARCHDHKFDPIPTRDYYALAGILRSAVSFRHDNVSKWIDAELPLPPERQSEIQQWQRELTETKTKINDLKKQLEQSGREGKFVAIKGLEGVVVDNRDARLVGDWTASESNPPIVGTEYLHDGNAGKGFKTATFEPKDLPPGEYQVRFAFSSGENRAARLPVKVFSADGEATVIVNQRAPKTDDGTWVELGQYRFEESGQAYVLISNENTDGHVIVDAIQFLPTARRDSETHPATTKPPSVAQSVREQWQTEQAALEKRQQELQTLIDARPRYLTILEELPPQDLPVHIRGDVHNLGEVVPRGYLSALRVRSEPLPQDSGGRLQLAKWITSADNPLTARVYANRVWSWLMGQGIVPSVNNFGTTGSPPSHPELLDELALQLIESNWSTKALVRTIVMSDAYRRSVVEASPEIWQLDPSNRLYWRGAKRRITVESMRDAMLQISGELELTPAGSLIPVSTTSDYNYKHSGTRRSVYQPVFRNSLPELYEAFDFADSSVPVGVRSRSTVAPQALVMLNHPWVIERAEHAAEMYTKLASDRGWPLALEQLFEACYARQARRDELQACLDFLTHDEPQASTKGSQRLAMLIQSLFASIDFRYLD